MYDYLGILLHLCSSALQCLVQCQTLDNFGSDRWTQPAAGHARSEVMGLGKNELASKVRFVMTIVFTDSDGHTD